MNINRAIELINELDGYKHAVMARWAALTGENILSFKSFWGSGETIHVFSIHDNDVWKEWRIPKEYFEREPTEKDLAESVYYGNRLWKIVSDYREWREVAEAKGRM
jgi:hypothetical protein